MISHLNGILEHIDRNFVVVDVNNIGYQVKVSASVLSRMPKVGDQIMLFTYQVVREDDISLYGFLSKEERSLFALLLSVSGIGPRTAQSMLAGLPAERLVAAIAQGNVELISTVPGIGQKTAQKLVIDLKEKVAKAYAINLSDMAVGIKGDQQMISDAISALVALGYSPREARDTIVKSGADLSSQNVEAIVKQALRSLV